MILLTNRNSSSRDSSIIIIKVLIGIIVYAAIPRGTISVCQKDHKEILINKS